MDLFYQRGHPNGVNPKIVKIPLLYFLNDSGQIAALKAAQHCSWLSAVKVHVIGGVSVVKSIGQHKVDGRTLPIKIWGLLNC